MLLWRSTTDSLRLQPTQLLALASNVTEAVGPNAAATLQLSGPETAPLGTLIGAVPRVTEEVDATLIDATSPFLSGDFCCP